MSSISMQDAIEVFVRGFSVKRSITHSYVPEQLDHGVWVMRDGPRKRGNYRSEEYVGATDPATLDTVARAHMRGRYNICAILEDGADDAPLRSGYKELGYRLMTTEFFMVHDLKRIKKVDVPVEIERVTTPAMADALAKAAGQRQILPAYLDMTSTPMRAYVARDGEKIVGWVSSIAAAGCAWCNNMFVLPEYRRRGIARALMTKMLQDDKAFGARANVLLASHAGAKLYPIVGYQQIGMLYMYTPKKKG